MKTLFRLIPASLTLFCLLGTATAEQKPNVLFIFADDMSYETIGAYGMLDIDTPHLDTLVERGATFTHAYNMGAWNGAVCVASRAMLNTGRFVWTAHSADLGQYVQENRMWSQRMKQAGYETFMTGKWHVKTKADGIFDVAAHVRGGMPNQTPAGYNRPKDEEDYKNGWKPWDPQHGGFWKGGTHWSEVVADDGIAFLKQAAETEEPFFMYLAFNAAHDPRQAPKEYVDRYPLSRIQMPENFLPEYPYAEEICGKTLRDERLMPYPRTEYAVKVNRQEYFALITHMDDQIGRILQALEETGQAENTYIVFTADHGLAVGHHGLVGKQNMYDHSVRVPFMIVGPSIQAGMKIDAPVYLQDVVPTSLELAGNPTPEGVDFESLMPLLRGETTKHYDSVYGAYTGTQRMITKNGWKFIYYPTADVERLFNLNNDPNEMNDLASNPENAPKMLELRAALEKLSNALNDPINDAEEPVSAVEPTQLEGDALSLPASQAKIHTNSGSPAKYMSTKKAIGYWTNPESWLSWTFTIPREGSFNVQAEVGAGKDVAVTVTVDETSRIATIPASGDLKKYAWVDLGSFNFEEAETCTLSIQPVKENWSNPINLRGIRFVPAK